MRARPVAWGMQKYTPKDKDGWKDSDTTDSTQEQSSALMLKAVREMKYEHLKLKYLSIDKMWIFLIFWIINPPSGKSVKKLWDIFTASSWVWGCLVTWWFKLAFAGDLCPQKLSPGGSKSFSWRKGHKQCSKYQLPSFLSLWLRIMKGSASLEETEEVTADIISN